MSSEWYETTLGEICKFTAGSAFKPEHQGGKAGQYPFIKVSDMNLSGNEIFIRHAQNFVSAELKDEMNAKEHPAGATVFAKIGVALQSNRRRLLVRPTIIDNNMMSATPKAGKISSRFLYFLLSTLDFNTISAGSALPYLNVSDLQKMNVTIPRDGETQHDIENVLGALDDRITLLRETNTTLEAIAQALFKSWFIDFDPVRAKIEGRAPEGMDEATAALFPDSFEETELGMVPRGWKATRVAEVAEVVKGKSYSSKDLVETHNTALVTLKSFERGGGFRMDGFKPYSGAYKPAQIVRAGDLILAYTDVTQAAELIGKPAIVVGVNEFQTLVASLDVGVIRPNEAVCGKQFLYGLFRTDAFQAHTLSHTSGTTVLHLAKDGVGSYFFPLPTVQLAHAFEEIASAIGERKQTNSDAIRTLATLRDTLLPRLISGQLRLPEAVAEMEAWA